MDIRPPRWLVALYDRFESWGNVPLILWPWHIVRLDLILMLLFVICVGWYYATGGWILAVTGALMFAFCTMVGLWFLRR
jgi:hypothetical protein